MTEEYLARNLMAAAYVSLQTAGPPLIVAALVGFVTALFQGVTQIQDQSLPLTLKILAVAAVFLLFGAVLSQPILRFTDDAFRNFAYVSR